MSSWNYQRMLNLGFCYCIAPILEKLYKEPQARSNFLKRHMEFFNAHPYFASFALGATARLEEQHVKENWPSPRPISVLKNRLCGPLGAIGDRLFWKTIKPLIAIIGVLTTICYGIAGPIVLLVLYNVPHIYLRYYGIVRGYNLGFDIVRELSKRKFRRYIEHLEIIGLSILGLAIGAYGISVGVNQGWVFSGFFLIAMIVTFIFIRLRKPIILPILINVGILLGYSFLIGA